MKNRQTFEERMERLLNEYHVPGSIIAIAKHGKIVYEKAFGYKNVEKQEKIDGNTVFGLASLTKSFTCVAIMQLAEKGKLNIDAPVIQYLPKFALKNQEDLKKITVYHFMTHSSGLPPLPSLDYAMGRERNDDSMVDYLELPDLENQIKSYEQLMTYISESKVKLFANPGDMFSYSNDAYGLLGAIIENVSGIPYEQYVLENIILPCGMSHTYFMIEDYKSYENITSCYEVHERDGQNELYLAQDWWDAPAMRATGFLKSTANDMIVYASLFINQGVVNGTRILTEESVKQMLHPHMKMDPIKFYGYGLAITLDYFGKKLVDHGGSLQSISSKLAILPEEGITAIFLSNLSGFPASRMMECALNAYFGRDLDADFLSKEEYVVESDTLSLYKGEYRSGEGMDVTIEIKDHHLLFTYKEKVYPIKFIKENVFLAYVDDVAEPVELLMDESDMVYAISIYHRIVPKVK